MTDYRIQQGETLRLTVTVAEEGANTAELVATDGTSNVLTSLVNFDGLTADLSTTETVIPPGTYDYYVRITWDDDTVDILPDASDCEDECEFPKLIVCEVPGVS